MARLDADRWSMVTPAGATESVLEVRDASVPSSVLASYMLPLALSDGAEHAAVASSGVTWLVAREPSDAVWLVAHRLGAEPVLRALPDAGASSPLFAMAALADGAVVIGAAASAGGTLEGASVAGGYVARARLVGTTIVIDRVRRIGHATTGVGARADGTVFVPWWAIRSARPRRARSTPTRTAPASSRP